MSLLERLVLFLLALKLLYYLYYHFDNYKNQDHFAIVLHYKEKCYFRTLCGMQI